MNNNLQKQPQNTAKMVIKSEAAQKSIQEVLGKKTAAFTASLLDLINADRNLKECNPQLVLAEAMKAAALDLPINKNLGFAYIIAYKGQPQFQLGYKGLTQLAQRTGQYSRINRGRIYEGQAFKQDPITGDLEIIGEKTTDSVTAYFAFFRMLNGYEQIETMTKEEVKSHMKKYSKAHSSKYSPWQTDFDAMAEKTVLKRLLSRWGFLSIEFADALKKEELPQRDEEDIEIIDIPEAEPHIDDPKNEVKE